MKKFLVIFAMVLGAALTINAQPRAIGLRGGFGAEVSYQHTMGENMVSLDFGIPAFTGVEAVATYDWINPFGTSFPWEHKGEWNWHLGVGAGVAWHWYGIDNVYNTFGTFAIGVAGRVGVEYNFWFPLQLAVDYRPIIGPEFAGTYVWPSYEKTIGCDFYGKGLIAGAIAFAVRYKF